MRFITPLVVGLLLGVPATGWSQVEVRVATYNIKFLSTSVQNQGDRLTKLRQVLDLLDAHVIGLQEIADRAALELLFPPGDWHIFIDDDSGQNQDLALVVRRTLTVNGIPADQDADDQHFLFPGSSNDFSFPNRRDVLFAEVGVPNTNETFVVMVHHGKSRFGGRAVSEPRRVASAQALIQRLEQDFDEVDFILLGDFNDNPDDRSLNILESGSPASIGGPEEVAGPFLINLTEPLMVDGHVSHGRKSNELIGDLVDTIDPKSRDRNNDHRGDNVNTGDILFDQILIPPQMVEHYVVDSAHVFNHAVGARGNDTTRASDHLPVVATFVFNDQPVDLAEVRIVALLPNPAGTDAGNEQVTIRNDSAADVNLTGWVLRDRAGNEFALGGTVQTATPLVITMDVFSMPLNNSGDEVSLIDDQGIVRNQVEYQGSQVTAGGVISFP